MKDYNYENECLKLVFSLFDALGFRQNIILDFFRASIKNDVLENFQEKTQYRLIKDITRNDRFCIFIPELQSNMQLYELASQMDYLCYCSYIPLATQIEEFLYNLEICQKKGAVSCNMAKFEAAFDMDLCIYFNFDKQYYESANVENILKEWENTFAGSDIITRNFPLNFVNQAKNAENEQSNPDETADSSKGEKHKFNLFDKLKRLIEKVP